MLHIIKFDKNAITPLQSQLLSKLPFQKKPKISGLRLNSDNNNQNDQDEHKKTLQKGSDSGSVSENASFTIDNKNSDLSLPNTNSNSKQKLQSHSKNVENEKKNGNKKEPKTEPANAKCFGLLKPAEEKSAMSVISRPHPLKLWFDMKLESDIIIEKRLMIKKELLKCKSARNIFIRASKIQIDNEVLNQLITLYDREFFKAKFFQKLKQQSTEFILDIGDPIYKFPKGWAGFFRLEGDVATIAIHKGMNDLQFKASALLPTSSSSSSSPQGINLETCEEVNGILCFDKIDVLQIVLEHELIHLFIAVFLRKHKVAHGPQFQELCKSIFGHTLYTHAIGHSCGLERVYEEEDRLEKLKTWKIKDLVRLTRLNYSSSVQNNNNEEDRVDRMGMIVQLFKDDVTIMSTDGTLIEKIPFKELTKISNRESEEADDQNDSNSDDHEGDDEGESGTENNAEEDEEQKDEDIDNEKDSEKTETENKKQNRNHHNNSQKTEKDIKMKLLKLTNLFIKNKATIQKGSTVSYKLNRDNLVIGQVISKKQSVAQIQISPYFIGLIPYHCLNIV